MDILLQVRFLTYKHFILKMLVAYSFIDPDEAISLNPHARSIAMNIRIWSPLLCQASLKCQMAS